MNEKKHHNRSGRWAVLGLNLLLMIAIAFILGWVALRWLDFWTGHGDETVVPDVKGMSYDAAVDRLTSKGLTVEISDSVYDLKLSPGVVVDQNPHVDTRVKPGRLIYLTINAFSPKMVTVPRLTDISARQAKAILAGLGIMNVQETSVFSEYKDLVLGVKCDGRRLQAGARVPINARIVLEVGDGAPGLDAVEADSLASSAGGDHIELLNLN